MLPRLLSLAFGAVAFAACGSSSSNGDGGVLMRGDGGCFYPVAGASCSDSDVSCIQGNPCCDGKWQCTSGKWNLLQFGCACQMADAGPTDSGSDAGSFACGAMTCTASQYCVERAIPDASDSFTCKNLPAACASTPTCTCVKASNPCAPTPVTQCNENPGQVTVHCG